jgi:hypothetical protein
MVVVAVIPMMPVHAQIANNLVPDDTISPLSVVS